MLGPLCNGHVSLGYQRAHVYYAPLFNEAGRCFWIRQDIEISYWPKWRLLRITANFREDCICFWTRARWRALKWINLLFDPFQKTSLLCGGLSQTLTQSRPHSQCLICLQWSWWSCARWELKSTHVAYIWRNFGQLRFVEANNRIVQVRS